MGGHGNLGLQRQRVDTVRMQTLVNRASLIHKGRDALVRHDDMGRGNCLFLVQSPNVQFVNRLNTGNLAVTVSRVVAHSRECHRDANSLAGRMRRNVPFRDRASRRPDRRRAARSGVGLCRCS